MNPRVTIITTVRNGASYILDMLNSIKNQTYNDFEHIVVDDGSTDATGDVISKFVKNNPEYPIKVFAGVARGRGKSINFAVSKAKAAWVAIIDADDLWHPQKLEVQMQIIDQMDPAHQPTVLATDSQSFVGNPPTLGHLTSEAPRVRRLDMKDLLVTNPICHSSTLIKRSEAYYHENRSSQFDLELWLRIMSGSGTICVLQVCLTYHRKHEKQSFEALLGTKMIINSYLLKAKYSLRHGHLLHLTKSTLTLVYILITPKKVKRFLKARKKLL